MSLQELPSIKHIYFLHVVPAVAFTFVSIWEPEGEMWGLRAQRITWTAPSKRCGCLDAISRAVRPWSWGGAPGATWLADSNEVVGGGGATLSSHARQGRNPGAQEVAGESGSPSGRDSWVRARGGQPAAVGARRRGAVGEPAAAEQGQRRRANLTEPGPGPTMYTPEAMGPEESASGRPGRSAPAKNQPKRSTPSIRSVHPGPKGKPAGPKKVPDQKPVEPEASSEWEKAAIQKRAEGRTKVPPRFRDSIKHFFFSPTGALKMVRLVSRGSW